MNEQADYLYDILEVGDGSCICPLITPTTSKIQSSDCDWN